MSGRAEAAGDMVIIRGKVSHSHWNSSHFNVTINPEWRKLIQEYRVIVENDSRTDA